MGNDCKHISLQIFPSLFALINGCHMKQPAPTILGDKESIPVVSIQPVGNPVPISNESHQKEEGKLPNSDHDSIDNQDKQISGDKK